MTLTKTIFLACDKVLDRYPAILPWNLSRMSEKVAILGLPIKSGRPRCLAVARVTSQGRICWIAVIVEECVFLLNKILDLTWFIDWPDQRQYLSRHDLILVTTLEVVEKTIKSSANNKWFSGEQAHTILKPRREPNRSLEITSEPIIKRNGKSGSPCLSPHEGVNNPKVMPFNKTEKEDVEIHRQT